MINRSAARKALNDSPIGATIGAVKSIASIRSDVLRKTRLPQTFRSITKSIGQSFQAIIGASVTASAPHSTHSPRRRSPVIATIGCMTATATQKTRWNNASRGATSANR